MENLKKISQLGKEMTKKELEQTVGGKQPWYYFQGPLTILGIAAEGGAFNYR